MASTSPGGGGVAPWSDRAATVLCLNRGRFKVEVEWLDFAGNRGPGRVWQRPPLLAGPR